MQRLANFSIETDDVVLLHFRGGGSRRVAVGQLARYLPVADLQQVRAALRLRQQFLLRHMPRLGAVALLLGGVSAALLMGGGQAVANLFHPAPAPAPAPAHGPEVRMLLPQPAAQQAAISTPAREAKRPVATPLPAMVPAAGVLPNGKPQPAAAKLETKLPLVKPLTSLVGGLLNTGEPAQEAPANAAAEQ